MIPGAVQKNLICGQEGHVLSMASSYGTEYAGEFGRCVADGAMNALVRMEGSEAAARFAFALCDRVVAGVRGPTAVPEAMRPFAFASDIADQVVAAEVRQKPTVVEIGDDLERSIAALVRQESVRVPRPSLLWRAWFAADYAIIVVFYAIIAAFCAWAVVRR